MSPSRKPRFLLVNPWIHDFAAFNLWLRPYGFLQLHAFLREQGIACEYIDLLHVGPEEIERWYLPAPEDKGHGQGRFRAEVTPKPEAYQFIERRYRRFGIPANVLYDKLEEREPPAAVLLTSGMTYWYRGVQETIEVIREVWPDTPVILGGIYATLCEAHAREHSGADQVISGPWEGTLLPVLDRDYGLTLSKSTALATLPFASNDLYDGSRVAVTRFTQGCPFRCAYCAAHRLQPQFEARPPARIIEEIAWNLDGGRNEIALYDDALLFRADEHLVPVLEHAVKQDWSCSFHTPNGLHARYMTPRIAELFHASGFATVRLSFESIHGVAQADSDGKVEPADLEKALQYLFEAGYPKGDIDVYMLIGQPEQTDGEVRETAEFIHAAGGRMRPAEYSPVPGTTAFERDLAADPRLADEPLLHNPTVAPGWGFVENRLNRLKQFIRGLNQQLPGRTE
ncbi:B12-binding domain-containing radical SAM protein [Planctomycetota bacterium]